MMKIRSGIIRNTFIWKMRLNVTAINELTAKRDIYIEIKEKEKKGKIDRDRVLYHGAPRECRFERIKYEKCKFRPELMRRGWSLSDRIQTTAREIERNRRERGRKGEREKERAFYRGSTKSSDESDE